MTAIFHLRTPWDLPATTPVATFEGTITVPKHDPIRVIEVTMCDEHGVDCFNLTFYNMDKADILAHDENGRTHIHRALRRRGWEGMFFPGLFKDRKLSEQRI